MNGRVALLATAVFVSLGCSGGSNDGMGTPGTGGHQAAAGSGGGPGNAGGAGGGPVVGGACDLPAPCGGALVGTWRIDRYCLTGTQTSMLMPFSCASVFRLAVSGITATFNVDETFVVSRPTVMITTTETTPVRCFPGALTCEARSEAMMQYMLVDPAITSASCATSGADCLCTQQETRAQSSVSGTYTVSGTDLITQSDGEAPETGAYCVRGNELHLLIYGSNGAGEAVYIKQ